MADNNVSSGVVVSSGDSITILNTVVGLTVQSGGSVANLGNVSSVTDQGVCKISPQCKASLLKMVVL